jgi:hypothetical protein
MCLLGEFGMLGIIEQINENCVSLCYVVRLKHNKKGSQGEPFSEPYLQVT